MERLRHEDVEHVWAAMLTSRNKLIQLEHISNGGLVSSLVEQRAVFKKAIACNAAAIILIHNHPSGDSGLVTKIFGLPSYLLVLDNLWAFQS